MKTRMMMSAALVLLLAATVWAQNQPNRAEQPFSDGGRVNLEMGGGGYEVRAGASDKIVVTYSTEKEEQLKSVEVRFVGGHDSTHLKIHGPHNNFHATIELPPHTDLYVRLEAGELQLRGVEGNKDIESHAGDLDISVGRAEDYGDVDASVGAGDLNAPAFHVNKGGLFRSFKQHGTGKYRLHVHLGAGDLNLH